MHERIDWSDYAEQVYNFKEQQIYPVMIETEKKERSMMKWLNTLSYHTYTERKPTDTVSDDASQQVNRRERTEQFRAAYKAGLIEDKPRAAASEPDTDADDAEPPGQVAAELDDDDNALDDEAEAVQ